MRAGGWWCPKCLKRRLGAVCGVCGSPRKRKRAAIKPQEKER